MRTWEYIYQTFLTYIDLLDNEEAKDTAIDFIYPNEITQTLPHRRSTLAGELKLILKLLNNFIFIATNTRIDY
jgi:hypothetical protein